MTARVLVVDDIYANVKLLEDRLLAEYFDVMTAMNGPDALDICEKGLCDIVLLDVMMPGMDGFEVCRRLKANPATHHIPVVMVTALDQPEHKVTGLQAGADDFLTKPIDDVALITRVKNLTRLKMLTDEYASRASTAQGGSSAAGVVPLEALEAKSKERAKIMLVDNRQSSADRLIYALEDHHDVEHEMEPQQALFQIAEGQYDMAIISLSLDGFDGLRLCGQIRSLERTRQLPVLVIVDTEDKPKLLRALDMGVNDYVPRPVDRNELLARISTQLRKKHYTDHLKDTVQQSVAMAMLDSLTGLHNRRFLNNHLDQLVGQAKERAKSLAVVLLDIDHFKSINDTYGHDCGDEVLKEFAARLKTCVRTQDLACRYGGEEFIIVMPETSSWSAQVVAERMRRAVESKPFAIEKGARTINVTASLGLATMDTVEDTGESVIKRADQALYRAKREGRNRVVSDAA
jgi:two-component system, cell cycle response regulator